MPCFDRERPNGLSSFECPLISLDRSHHGDSIAATPVVYPTLPEEPLKPVDFAFGYGLLFGVTPFHLMHYCL